MNQMASSRDRDGLTRGITSSTRKTASLQGLVAKGKTLKRHRDEDDNDKNAIRLDKRRLHDDKENSPGINARDFFAKYKRLNSEPRPNFLAEATRIYHAATASSAEHHLQPTLADLLARINGLDAVGHPLRDHDAPTQAAFDALFAQDADLSRPIEDGTIRLEFPEADGKTTVKEVRWGDTWAKFQRHYARRREELAGLQGEMDGVVGEMRALEEEVEMGDGEMQKVEGTHEDEMMGFKREAEAVERACREDVLRLEREEKEQSRQFRRKFDEFMKNVLGE